MIFSYNSWVLNLYAAIYVHNDEMDPIMPRWINTQHCGQIAKRDYSSSVDGCRGDFGDNGLNAEISPLI